VSIAVAGLLVNIDRALEGTDTLSLLPKPAIRQERFEAILGLQKVLVDDRGWQANLHLMTGMNLEYSQPL
jgi:hypothetical protein